jgi:integrase
MKRRNLAPAFVRNARPAPKGKRIDHWDAAVPGFGLRVTDTGSKSYVLTARFPSNPKHPTRRTIGDAASMPLGDARQIARDWLALISDGIDPQQQIAGRREAAAEGPLTFGATFERWCDEVLAKQRRGRDVEGNFRREFMPRWKDRPLASLVRRDIRDACVAVAGRGHNVMASALLKQAKVFFNWACEAVDLKNNPAITIKGSVLFGPRPKRDRTPNDSELAAIWNATEGLDYPAQPFFRMAILTGQRRAQIAGLRWREIDLDAGTWTCPAKRMKMNKEFTLPLSAQMIALLKSLPRFDSRDPDRDFVFSVTNGQRPLSATPIDQARKALAAQLPDVAHWTLHDFRRSMRSTMRKLRIASDVGEACLSHERTGIEAVYNHAKMEDELIAAMQRWADHVDQIAAPDSANVVPLRAA